MNNPQLQQDSRIERHGFAIGDRVIICGERNQRRNGYGHVTNMFRCAAGAKLDNCRQGCRVYLVNIIGGCPQLGEYGFAASEMAHAD